MINTRTRVGLVTVVALLLAGSGAAFTFDVEPTSGSLEDNLTVTFRQLDDPDTDYQLVGVRSDGSTFGAGSFTATSEGKGRVRRVFDPVGNDAAYISEQSWHYRLQYGNGTVAGDVHLYYGPDLHYLEAFNDGTTNGVYHGDVSGGVTFTESGGTLDVDIGSGSIYCLRVPLEKDETLLMNATGFSGGNDGDMQVYLDEEKCDDQQSGEGDTGLDQFSTQELWRVWHDGTTGFVRAGGNGGGSFDMVSGNDTELRQVYMHVFNQGSSSQTMTVEASSQTPNNSQKFYDRAAQFGKRTDANRLYTWQDVTTVGGVLGLDYNTGTEWEEFLEDARQQSASLRLRETQNDTVGGVYAEAAARTPLTLIRPRDGQVLEASNDTLFSFRYRLPDEYKLGSAVAETHDGSEWIVRGAPVLEDTDGNCVVQETPEDDLQDAVNFLSLTFQFAVGLVTGFFGLDPSALTLTDAQQTTSKLTNDCLGHKIQFRVNTANITQDVEKWRVRYINTKATDSALQGTQFVSNSHGVTVSEAFKEIVPVAPLNDVVLTTVTPTFVFKVISEISGQARLKVNQSTQKRWTVISGDVRERFVHDLSSGVSEGPHSWSAEYLGDDGDTVSTGLLNFTVNSSIARQANFSLNHPSDGSVLSSRTLNLSYDVEATSSGTLEAYIDGRVIDTKDLGSGTHNGLSTELRGVPPGNHTWFLTYDTGNRLFQSNTSEFKTATEIVLNATAPNDGATISQPPIVFKANVSTSQPATLELVVDDEQIATRSIAPDDAGIKELSINRDLSAGKHAWQFRLRTDFGRQATTPVRVFRLNVATPDQLARFGTIGRGLVQLTGGLGLAPQLFLSIIATILVLIVMALFGAFVDPMLGLASGILTTIAFTLMRWYPSWVAVVWVILAGAIVVRKMLNTFSSQGGGPA